MLGSVLSLLVAVAVVWVALWGFGRVWRFVFSERYAVLERVRGEARIDALIARDLAALPRGRK